MRPMDLIAEELSHKIPWSDPSDQFEEQQVFLSVREWREVINAMNAAVARQNALANEYADMESAVFGALWKPLDYPDDHDVTTMAKDAAVLIERGPIVKASLAALSVELQSRVDNLAFRSDEWDGGYVHALQYVIEQLDRIAALSTPAVHGASEAER